MAECISYEYSKISNAIIEKLCRTFVEYGLSDQFAMNNATYFTSVVFEKFMTNNGIKHITSVPYHPAMNGQEQLEKDKGRYIGIWNTPISCHTLHNYKSILRHPEYIQT